MSEVVQRVRGVLLEGIEGHGVENVEQRLLGQRGEAACEGRERGAGRGGEDRWESVLADGLPVSRVDLGLWEDEREERREEKGGLKGGEANLSPGRHEGGIKNLRRVEIQPQRRQVRAQSERVHIRVRHAGICQTTRRDGREHLNSW